jgi:hypothetical protein
VQINDNGTFKAMSTALNEIQGADVASATTTNIGAIVGNYANITGTTTITGLGTVQAGSRRTVKFTGALILTHNATSLILPTGANITTAAGDTATFISLGAGNWICTQYQRASGQPLPATLVANLTGDVTGDLTGNADTATSAISATSATSATTAASADAVPWAGVTSKPNLFMSVLASRYVYTNSDTGFGNYVSNVGIEDVGSGQLRIVVTITYNVGPPP